MEQKGEGYEINGVVIDVIKSWVEFTKEADFDNADDVEEFNEGLRIESIKFKKLSEAMKTELEVLTDLQALAIVNCKILSMDNLPNLPKLVKLDLSDNLLTEEEIQKIAIYPNIHTLILSSNPLKDVSKLQFLSDFKQLVQLELFNCPVQKQADYSKKFFELIPSLKVLDFKDSEGNEVEQDDEESSGEEEYEEEDDDFVVDEQNGDKPTKKLKE